MKNTIEIVLEGSLELNVDKKLLENYQQRIISMINIVKNFINLNYEKNMLEN